MKKVIFILGLLAVVIAAKTYAFEIYNGTNAEIYSVAQGTSGGEWVFGTVPAGGTSNSWLISPSNLPATVYVCWYANTGCSYINIMSSSNSAQIQQANRTGLVCVRGTYAWNTKPSLQANQTDCPS